MIAHWASQQASFFRQLGRHLIKADVTVVDLTGFPSAIRSEVAAHLDALPPGLADRVIRIGF